MPQASEPLAERIRKKRPPRGQVATWWLGGGGFCFKTSQQTEIYVDPYLSDIVNKIFGQRRAFPAPISAREAAPDFLVITHWHEDHLDPGSVPVIAARSKKTVFVMPPSAMSRAVSWGVPKRRIILLRAGQTFKAKDLSVQAVPARHNAGVEGWETPEALCLLFDLDGIRIFFSGDTDYDSSLRQLKSHAFDAAFVCINGTGGNMNAHEAALLAWQLEVSTIVPMHHRLWKHSKPSPESTLDPAILERTYRNLGGGGCVVHPEIGGEFILRRKLPVLL